MVFLELSSKKTTEVLEDMMENPKPSVDLDVELCEKYLPNYQK